MNQKQIGIFTLTEQKEYKKQFETASWYEIIRVDPGTYPIYAEVMQGRVIDYSVNIPLPGIITHSFFVNRVFTSSSLEIDQNAGQPSVYNLSPYFYALKKGITDGTINAILFEGIQ